MRLWDFESHAHTFDQLLHPAGTGFTHLIHDVAVLVQGERRGIVAHVLLQGLDIVAGLDAVYSERVS